MARKRKIRIDAELYQRLERCAHAENADSVEQWLEDALHRLTAEREEEAAKRELTDRMRGLGYME